MKPYVSVCRRLGKPAWTAAVLLVTVLAVAAAKSPELPPLTTAPNNPRIPGKFVWADLVTDNALTAQQFYSGLFDWRFVDYGNYLVALNAERPLCGIFQRPRPKDESAKPRWFGYISVPNVSRTRDLVVKLGGRVVAEPQKMPKRGEQALFSDPEGALFGVVKSSSGDPSDFMAEKGDWIWVQLLSRDAAKAAAFYSKVAGYEVLESTATNSLSDFVLTAKGYARATVRSIPPAATQVKSSWLPFVRVNSITESLVLCQKLGGKTLIEASPQRLDGKVAVIADPTGAAIGIMEWSDTMVKGGR
jgi:predicted enzyme related to lactoylglutathione lyase